MNSEALQSFEDQVQRDFRRNVVAFVAFETLWGLGLPFAFFQVITPAYLNYVQSPKFIIGLVTSTGAILIPLQLMAERLFGGRHRKRNAWLLYSCPGLAFLLFGLTGYFFPALPNQCRIVLFFGVIVVFFSAVYLAQPVYYSTMTDNCPLPRRGRLIGLRTTGMGLAGLMNVYPARWVYQHFPAPDNYHVAMIIAGMFFVLSTLSILFIRDHIEPQRLESYRVPNREPLYLEIFFLLRWLWRQPNYRIYIFFLVLMVAAISLAPFLITYTRDILNLPPGQERLFNVVFLVACLVAGNTVGILADRWGFRSALLIMAGLISACFLVPLVFSSFNMLLFAYWLFCCASVTFTSVMVNMSVELLPKENPAHLFAAGNIFAMSVTLTIPPLFGRILDAARTAGAAQQGYQAVFTAAIVFSVICAMGMLVLVREPRTGRLYVIKMLDRP